MALITRCPVCGTQFKVVPDQLRISEGWVRCGQCAEVFDASSDLQQGEMDLGAPVLAAVAQDVPADVVPEQVGAIVEPAWPAYSAPAATESFTNYLNPVSAPTPLVEEVLQAGPVQDYSEPVPAIADIAEVTQSTEPTAEPVLFNETLLLDPSSESEASVQWMAENYSFTKIPATAFTGPIRLVRQMAFVAIGLLALLLALQVLVWGRDRIAASWPVAKPWLQSACGVLGCRVQPLRQIESVAIDSSSLSAAPNDVYRLSLVLKNHAMVDLATPALEFVLTDGDEQALFRRVLSPADLGAASRVLFAGREWAATVDMQVLDGPMKARIVGYRVLAFYP
jgi:predicted Zn finger-like uncharacterized protein